MIPTDDRGQTETLGYVLIFSIIIISIGAIYTSGITNLGDQRESVAFDNTERAMNIYASNVEDIYEHGAPSRATEFKLYENALAVNGSTRFSVTITNSSGATDTYGSFESQPLHFESEKGSITYEIGGVVRNRDGSRAVVLREPPFSFSENTTVLTHVQSTGEGSVAATSETVLVVSDRRQSRLKENVADDSEVYDVTLRIETTPARARAWENYLSAKGLTDTGNTDVSTGVVEYVYQDSEEVLVRQTIIDVTIEQ